jgi:hypothetical protein
MNSLCATHKGTLIHQIEATLRDTPRDPAWEREVLPFILWVMRQSDADPLAVEFAISDLALQFLERDGFEISDDKRGVLWCISSRIMLRYLQLRRYPLDLLEPAVQQYLRRLR